MNLHSAFIALFLSVTLPTTAFSMADTLGVRVPTQPDSTITTGAMPGIATLPTRTIRTLTDRLSSDEEIELVQGMLQTMKKTGQLDTLALTNALVILDDLAHYHFLKDDSLSGTFPVERALAAPATFTASANSASPSEPATGGGGPSVLLWVMGLILGVGVGAGGIWFAIKKGVLELVKETKPHLLGDANRTPPVPVSP